MGNANTYPTAHTEETGIQQLPNDRALSLNTQPQLLFPGSLSSLYQNINRDCLRVRVKILSSSPTICLSKCPTMSCFRMEESSWCSRQTPSYTLGHLSCCCLQAQGHVLKTYPPWLSSARVPRAVSTNEASPLYTHPAEEWRQMAHSL